MDPAMASSDKEEISPRRKRNAQDNEEITPPHKRSTWEIVDGGEEDVRTSGTEREDEGSKITYKIIYDEEEDDDEDAEHSSDDYDTELISEEDEDDEITLELLEEFFQGRSIWRCRGQGEASDVQTECGEASDAQTECGEASDAQTECGEASGAQTKCGEASDAQTECGKASDAQTKCGEASNAQTERCAICLEQFQGEKVGMPECCNHAFCLDCIQEWAKVTNKCPLDKKQFSRILVREGDKVGNMVPAPAPRKAKRNEEDQEQEEEEDEDEEEDEEEEEEDLTECELCEPGSREGRMLRCANCDLGYHCECLSPPLYSEPPEEWYCPYCATSDSECLSPPLYSEWYYPYCATSDSE